MIYEGYRLTLEHFISNNGTLNRIEEPITVQTFFDRTVMPPSAYVVGEVLHRMEQEIRNKMDEVSE